MPSTSTESAAKKIATSFVWRVNAPRGKFTGEQKAELVDLMENIASRISHGSASVEFSYDLGSVIATISAKRDAAMAERAQRRAMAVATRGIQGWVAKALLLWHGMGAAGRDELVRRLAADYLHEEQAKATAELLRDFQTIISLPHSGAPGTLAPS